MDSIGLNGHHTDVGLGVSADFVSYFDDPTDLPDGYELEVVESKIGARFYVARPGNKDKSSQ